MTTIDDIWRSFFRWQNRYSKSVLSSKAGLHNWTFSELFEEPTLSKKEINRRLNLKFDFFKGYLCDLDSDGPEYMQDHGRKLLTNQYPKRCNSSYGVWLYVADYGKPDFPSMSFAEQEISIFTPDIELLDWASVWSIIPFDFIYLRLPYEQRLTPPRLRNYAKYICNDLDFDGIYCDINPSLFSRRIGCLEIKTRPRKKRIA